MEFLSNCLGALPFEWSQYGFMRMALLAVIFIAPALALTGTVAVSGRMAFFSDALGHSALTGLGIGILLGTGNQLPILLLFGICWAMLLILVKQRGGASADTVISVFSSTTMALGLLIMAGSGGIAKYESMLVGDVLSVSDADLWMLLFTLIAVIVFFILMYGRLMLTGINADWARTRGINTRTVEYAFGALMAVVVMLSIQWIGTLLINSMLILPAASARNISRTTRQYVWLSIAIGLLSSVSGLIASFYLNTSAGAAIVICAAICYFITFAIRMVSSRNR